MYRAGPPSQAPFSGFRFHYRVVYLDFSSQILKNILDLVSLSDWHYFSTPFETVFMNDTSQFLLHSHDYD